VTFESVFKRKTPGVPHRGSYFRLIPLEFVDLPLSAIGSIKGGGRYNAQGDFEALYLADRPDNTLREVRMLRDDAGFPVAVPDAPKIIFTVDVRLQRVVDLSDDAVCAVLGVSFDELITPWRLIVALGRVPTTHVLGAAAREAGIEALIVPSAQHPGSKNLVVIPDRLLFGSSVMIHQPRGFAANVGVVVEGSIVQRRRSISRRRR
jgi:RES domain-containing protein